MVNTERNEWIIPDPPRATQKELVEKLVLEIGGSGWLDLTRDDFLGTPGKSPKGSRYYKALEHHIAICEKYADIPPFITEDPDGHTLMWAIRQLLPTLIRREGRALFLKLGLYDGHPRTFQDVGVELGVTRERARQIIMRATRKLRHPTRFKQFKPFLYPYNRADERAVMARYELHLRLSEVYPMEFSFNLVMRLRRRYLADALKAVNSSSFRDLNRLMAYSCSLQMGICTLCGEPAMPSSNWCLTHLELKNHIVMVCDGCGIKFPRNPSQLIGFTKRIGRTQHAIFHNQRCFHANQIRMGLHGGFKKFRNEVTIGGSNDSNI
jgi:hypothetical protein